jgi:hypothetical protein
MFGFIERLAVGRQHRLLALRVLEQLALLQNQSVE